MSHHTFPWQEAFLAALREMPVVQHACNAVGIERCTAYRARQASEDFAKAWEEAMEAGVDRAEQEAFRRGVVGFLEPVIDKGRLCFVYERYLDEDNREQWRMKLDENDQPIPLTVRKHSDALLAKVLSARRAAYRTERTELTGADGGPVATDNTVRASRVASLLAAAQARKEAEDFG
jgi:hypothetical protein